MKNERRMAACMLAGGPFLVGPSPWHGLFTVEMNRSNHMKSQQYAPYRSRKNRKRALGTRQNTSVAPIQRATGLLNPFMRALLGGTGGDR